jgi:hypothetical protein
LVWVKFHCFRNSDAPRPDYHEKNFAGKEQRARLEKLQLSANKPFLNLAHPLKLRAHEPANFGFHDARRPIDHGDPNGHELRLRNRCADRREYLNRGLRDAADLPG